MATELDGARRVLRDLNDLYVDVLLLRQRFPQHTEQLLNVPRHLSIVATDIENALLRVHYVTEILETLPRSGNA